MTEDQKDQKTNAEMNRAIRGALTDEGKEARRKSLREGLFGKSKDDDDTKEGDENA